MNVLQSKQAGVAAYKAGLGRAPSLNAAFVKAAFAYASGAALVELLSGYLYGWDIANLADGAPEDMPSVATLKSIEGAAS